MNPKIFLVLLFASLNSFGQQEFVLYFDFNKDTPNDQSIIRFDQWVTKNKEIVITKIEGYCDSIDSKEYNKKLAERRIASVQNLLENRAVKMKEDLVREAFGKEFKQSQKQADNRKVILFYTALAKPIPSELSDKIAKAKVGESIKLPNIYFFNNEARILPKSAPSLTELLGVLNENPTLKIEIQGHICCQTVFDVNDVSRSRAKAIYTYLIANNIDENRMSFKGYGSSKPVHPIPEKSALEEEENRRVEIMIVAK